jgi:hypothetical protein
MGPGLFALVVAGFVQSIAMIAMTANLLNARTSASGRA